MKQVCYSVILLPLLIYGDNLFIVKDKTGSVLKQKVLSHHHNACLEQDAKVFSLQAMYDDLRKEVLRARAAEMARHQEALASKSLRPASVADADQPSHTTPYALLNDAKHFKGGRYVWGGTSPDGFDCSGYVQYLYKKHGIDLPRTAWAQSKQGKPIDPAHLKKGDLLFFLTDKKRGIPVTHVGIYLGNGEFIHAASRKKGIIISPLNKGHYKKCFVSARRVLPLSS